MAVLGCGAQMAKLMDVSDQDVAIIEDTIAERLALGISQAQAQRQGVSEALAQLADERAMVMRAVDEQLGKEPANSEIAFANRNSDPVELPDSVIGNTLGAASKHPDYKAAKSGDAAAAVRLAKQLVTPDFIAKISEALAGETPTVVPVLSVESEGRNKIPAAAAARIASKLGLELDDGIVQADAPKRTGMTGVERIFNTPSFDGPVEPGGKYLLVDDTLTQGATFASLASHIRQGGGEVVGSVALTGKLYSATIALQPQTYEKLTSKLGDLEPQFKAATGYGFSALTESEARYLANFEPVDTIRNRITQGGEQARPEVDDGADGGLVAANKSQSKWVGEDGRWQFAPGQMLWNMMGDKAGPLLDRMYLRNASTEVRHAIRKMKLDQQKAMETTHEIVGAMREMSADERVMVSDIIERELKAGVTPSASAVQHAAMMNEAFENQTNELVRLGMLTQDAANRWRGKYLPRYYESKLKGSVTDAWADLIKFTKRGDTLKGIKGKHLRGRGLTQSISTSELDDYQAKGWEIRDKNFDPAVHDTVYVWRDFTKQEREDMGEIRDAGFRFTMGYMQTQKDIALGRMYEGIANNPEMSSRTKPDDTYVQVPDTTVPETNAKRYGLLAGKWVSRNMMAQLSLQQEMENDAIKLYRKALSIWKENKTVLNPVSHMNNFVSNLTMAHLAGVSYYDGHKYIGAIKDFASKASMVKEAHDAGLFLGSMSEEELGKMLPLELQSLVNKQDSKTMTGMKLAHTVLTWGLRRPAGIAYEFGDRFFKYLIYKDARAQGMEPQEAVDYAQKYIFTYDGLPTGARLIRDLFVPFFSYTYKAVPVLAETALTHPHRMAAPAALLAMASAAAYAIAAGGDDDDWTDSVKKYLTDADFRQKAQDKRDEEYKLLPEWMKDRTSFGSQKTLRLGTDKATGNPVFLDTSRFIPGGDLFDVTGNAGGLPLLQPLTLSNPLFSTYGAMILNKDAFTGKELVNKATDTDVEAGKKRADWMWKMATPAIAINQAHWDRAINAVAHANGDEELPIPDIVGGNLTGIGKDGMPVQAKYAAMNTFGIKARPMDLDMSEQIQKSVERKTLAELDAQLRQARMQNAKGVRSDRNFEKTREQIQIKKDRLKEGLTVDGDVKN